MSAEDSFVFEDINIINDVSYVRAEKVYKERINPFDKYTDVDFEDLYRFDKETAMDIVDLVREDLTHNSRQGSPISPEIMVMATLRYIAKGAYQKDIADAHGISQQSMSGIIRMVINALASRMRDYIYFPMETDEIQELKRGFYEIAGFPQCVGAIDCTHVKIKNPGGELGGRHRCRKGFYSINVQVICDSNCLIMDIVARWRGTAHDSRIWNESTIKSRLEQADLKGGVLLGDNGYGCSRILLTPFRSSSNLSPAQQRYNTAHILTRNTVERLFGQIKNKFRSFSNGINVDLETAKNMIIAIAVLYNISKRRNGLFATDDISDGENNTNNWTENQSTQASRSSYRDQFVNRFFQTR